MTVSTTAMRSVYDGNGSASAFPYAFRIFAADDLTVYHVDDAGVYTQLALGVDYFVAGVGEIAGGTVTLVDGPLDLNEQLVLVRETPVLQPTDVTNQGTFYPETHEHVFDRLTFLLQEIRDVLGYTVDSARVPRLGDHEVNGAGAYRAHGNRLESLADPIEDQDAVNLRTVDAIIESQLTAGLSRTPLVWTLTGDGATDTFAIAGAPVGNAAAYLVTAEGIYQTPGTHYSINQTAETITFDEAPENGAAIVVVAYGYRRGLDELEVYTTATLPTADSSNHRKVVLVHDAGQPEKMLVCLLGAGGSYAWAPIASGGYA